MALTNRNAKCSDEEFVEIFEKYGAAETARRVGINLRNVYARRERLEVKIKRQLMVPNHRSTRNEVKHEHRIKLEIENGVILVGSDAHIWPGAISPAMQAFIKFSKELSPKAVVLNGDVMDFPRISRHPPIGWETTPSVESEIMAAREQLTKIEAAMPPKAARVWCLGNHDARFETRLATVAPEFAKLYGVHLKDHFPLWQPCWSVWINDQLVIKHRFKGGTHATHNNTLWAGKSIVTGHLHSAKVTPLTDLCGTRWGVDTGCLANPDGPQFRDYSEDSPKNWRAAFGVFTFYKGKLLQPELALVESKDRVDFRGELHRI